MFVLSSLAENSTQGGGGAVDNNPKNEKTKLTSNEEKCKDNLSTHMESRESEKPRKPLLWVSCIKNESKS